jgi:hypothetical protein
VQSQPYSASHRHDDLVDGDTAVGGIASALAQLLIGAPPSETSTTLTSLVDRDLTVGVTVAGALLRVHRVPSELRRRAPGPTERWHRQPSNRGMHAGLPFSELPATRSTLIH